jgi:site-specific DNA recombinase
VALLLFSKRSIYMPKPALIYCRVSGKAQEEVGTSLESQEAACVQHAEQLGFQVGSIVRETYSGIQLWDRPKLSEARIDIKAGKYGALIAYAVDRLSRDPIHLAIISDDCDRGGVQLLFVTEQMDDTEEGRLVRYIKGYAAKKEHEKIKERTMRGRHQRGLQGKVPNAGVELTATAGTGSRECASSTSPRLGSSRRYSPGQLTSTTAPGW